VEKTITDSLQNIKSQIQSAKGISIVRDIPLFPLADDANFLMYRSNRQEFFPTAFPKIFVSGHRT
jgi:hypothetical protein